MLSLDEQRIVKITRKYKNQDYRVSGLCSSSGMLKNTPFRKLDLFPFSGEEMGDTYSLGSVRKSYPQSLDQG
jgi:hypothetical protein